MTDIPQTTEEGSPLTEEQTQRAAALGIARSALSDAGSSVVTSSNALAKRFGTQDLIDVAQWILDGKDPLAEYHASTPAVIAVRDDAVESARVIENAGHGVIVTPLSLYDAPKPPGDGDDESVGKTADSPRPVKDAPQA